MQALHISGDKPTHVGIIMDGNGRWGEKHGKDRSYGHKCAISAVEQAMQVCLDQGISYLTLYAFSTENWSRPKQEISCIFDVIAQECLRGLDTLMRNNIRLRVVGDISGLPQFTVSCLQDLIDTTKDNTSLYVNVALNYSGQDEIVASSKEVVRDVFNQVIEKFLEEGYDESSSCGELIKFMRKYRLDLTTHSYEQFLYTRDLPPVDLVIRTGARKRLSNFLLWKIAYAELYFTDVLWPDFREKDFMDALEFFQRQHRTFGAVTESSASIP